MGGLEAKGTERRLVRAVSELANAFGMLQIIEAVIHRERSVASLMAPSMRGAADSDPSGSGPDDRHANGGEAPPPAAGETAAPEWLSAAHRERHEKFLHCLVCLAETVPETRACWPLF